MSIAREAKADGAQGKREEEQTHAEHDPCASQGSMDVTAKPAGASAMGSRSRSSDEVALVIEGREPIGLSPQACLHAVRVAVGRLPRVDGQISIEAAVTALPMRVRAAWNALTGSTPAGLRRRRARRIAHRRCGIRRPRISGSCASRPRWCGAAAMRPGIILGRSAPSNRRSRAR